MKNKTLTDWVDGAMLPSELMFLEKELLSSDCNLIIECGRQDAYSTVLLGEFAKLHSLNVLSIDFDDNLELLRKAEGKLKGLPVKCISGDIHAWVPKLIKENMNRRIAVIQDGPKGWEGLSTLLASTFFENVVLLAQHNLHLGHKSRDYFCSLPGGDNAFLESRKDEDLIEFRKIELEFFRNRKTLREVDITSLGIIKLTKDRDKVINQILLEKGFPKYWSPKKTYENWQKNNYEYVGKLRASLRFSFARFIKR
jgi:hypothetical protein